jgi:hypothetical protein
MPYAHHPPDNDNYGWTHSDDESTHSAHPPQFAPLNAIFPDHSDNMATLHYDEYIPHLQAITQSPKPHAACYRQLWTDSCTKPHCRWEHDTKTLQQSWHYHQDLLSNSPYHSNQRYTSANPPKILPRPAPMHPRPHQDYPRPSRHTNDPHHASSYPLHR